MERASQHRIKHDNKTLSRRARRGPAPHAGRLALLLGIFCAAAFGSPVFSRSARGQEKTPSAARKLAEQDVKVGRFYFKSGKYEASISRFQSAVAHDPAWAVPHAWLGAAFEKKHDPRHALDEYREYLKISPHAKDARKIRRRMEKLARDLKEQAARGH